LSATDAHGHSAPGTFYAGIFSVGQKRAGKRDLTVLKLTGPAPSGCTSAHTASVARKRVKTRSLWGNAKGDYRTVGRDASATERATVWLTQDSCAGTLIRVASDSVTVDDFAHHRSFVLRAPQSFLAHAGKGG